MKIQIGQVTLNKTQKYLRPCLRAYGDTFRGKIAQICSIAWGIGDMILVKNGVTYQQELFVLIDTMVAKRFFMNFMEWIRYQSYYTDDYVFDDIEHGRLHMLILKIPDQFLGAFESFKLGNYSKMYDEKTIKFLFDDNSHAIRVVTKDHNYRIEFVNLLNNMYETHMLPKEFEGELDFKPNLKHEIFNSHEKSEADQTQVAEQTPEGYSETRLQDETSIP